MLNNNYSTNSHIIEIDYLRCFAILAVIIIHTVSATTRVSDISNVIVINILASLSSFAVPLFICISGFVLYHTYNQNNMSGFHEKRFQRIIPPYIIFTIVYLIANIFKTYVVTGIFEIPTINSLICSFLFATSNEHMWFFLIIIELYLIFPILLKLFNTLSSKKIEWILILLGLLIQYIWNISAECFIVYVGDLPINLSNKLFFCMIFYFILGMFISKSYIKIKQLLSPKIVSIIILIITISIAIILHTPGLNIIPIFSYIYCISVILLLFCVGILLTKKSTKNILITIGLYSFGIYLIHPLIQGVLGYIIFPTISITPDLMVYYPLVFITTVIFSTIAVFLIKKIPFNKYIIG